MHICIISGSPRSESISHRIALHLQGQLQSKGQSVDLIDVREHSFPLLEKVYSKKENTPEEYHELFDRLYQADAFILVSPEYNGSYAPALKNLIDHFAKGPFSKKAFGIVTGSTGAMGGMRAAQQMLQLVPALFGIASPHMLLVPLMDKKFDANAVLIDESFEKNRDNFLNEFLWLADRLGGK